jgi:hypothetical protein
VDYRSLLLGHRDEAGDERGGAHHGAEDRQQHVGAAAERALAGVVVPRGRRAPVTIEVAIALAVSWKPLVKSKASAATTTMTRSSSESTGPDIPVPRPRS